MQLDTLETLLGYVDWSNTQLLECSTLASEEQLDRALEIGPGTLRRILIHTWAGEDMWLKRMRQEPPVGWPDESAKTMPAELLERHAGIARERGEFLRSLSDADLGRVQRYRDSKGNFFDTTLGDMIMQSALHSKHHQAQSCNALRRLGLKWPELDYMMRIRKPI